MNKGIVRVGDTYYCFEQFDPDSPWAYEVSAEVYPLKRGVVEKEQHGYDSAVSSESTEWTVFEDESGQRYSVREGKAWVRQADVLDRKSEHVHEVQHLVDIDVDSEHAFVEQNLDI